MEIEYRSPTDLRGGLLKRLRVIPYAIDGRMVLDLLEVTNDEKSLGDRVYSDMPLEAARQLRDFLNQADLGTEPLTLGDIRGKIAKLPDDMKVEDIDLGRLDCD